MLYSDEFAELLSSGLRETFAAKSQPGLKSKTFIAALSLHVCNFAREAYVLADIIKFCKLASLPIVPYHLSSLTGGHTRKICSPITEVTPLSSGNHCSRN